MNHETVPADDGGQAVSPGQNYDIVKPGDVLPSGKVLYQNSVVDICDVFNDKTGVILGVLGAFYPVCGEIHLRGFLDQVQEFHKRGIRDLVCITVNDPYVVKAWKATLGITDQIIFLCDTSGALCHRLGILKDHASEGLGYRCRRSALIVGPKCVVRWVGLDAAAYVPNVLDALDAVMGGGDEQTSSCRGTSVDKEQDSTPPAVLQLGLSQPPPPPEAQQEEPAACAVEDIERHIRGEPFDAPPPRSLEMKRSQCDLLYSDADSLSEDADSDNTSTRDDEEGTGSGDEGGGGVSVPLVLIDPAKCVGRSLHDVSAKPGDEKMDIKFAYECPKRVYIQRAKSVHKASLWDVTITADHPTALGYVVVNNRRYYAKQIHFHSPALHTSTKTSIDSQAVEMHVVHARKGVADVVVICFTFAWEPENDDTTCILIESLMGAAHSPDFNSDGTYNVVDGGAYPFDLQGMIALNTMAAFYRYGVPASVMPGFIRLAKTREETTTSLLPDNNNDRGIMVMTMNADPSDRFLSATSVVQQTKYTHEVCWLVARDMIPLSWKQFELLYLLLGTPSVVEDVACSLSRSVSRLLSPSAAAGNHAATLRHVAEDGKAEDAVRRSSTLMHPQQKLLLSPTASHYGRKYHPQSAAASAAPVVLVVSSLLR